MAISDLAGLFGARSAAPVPAPSAMPGRSAVRSIAAAGGHAAVYGNWIGQTHPLDQVLRHQLEPLRRRARDLALNDPYARGYLRSAMKHIAGPSGVAFKVLASGGVTEAEAAALEAAYAVQSRRGNFDLSGRLSRVDAEHLFVRTVERDGECFVRLVYGGPGRYRFGVQFVAAERIDVGLCRELPDGNFIWLGIEYAPTGRPAAYWVRVPRSHAGGVVLDRRGGTYERVPAADMIHGFRAEDPEQTRGIPALVASAKELRQHGGMVEAELIGARAAAAKMGFYKRTAGLYDADGQPVAHDVSDDGMDLLTEAVPGHFEILPEGVEVETFDPQYNGSGLSAFAKACLRALATSVGVSYPTAAGDLEGVNFSSLRHGALDERDTWRTGQRWLIDTFCEPLREKWLAWALDTGQLKPLRPRDFERLNVACWRPRGWQWVDPAKEARGHETAIRLRIKSRTAAAAEMGLDLETTLREIAAEEALAERLGVDLAAADAALGIAPEAPGEDLAGRLDDLEEAAGA